MEELYAKESGQVYETAISLWKSGLIAASSGNISARLPNRDWIAITPSGLRYDRLRSEDIVLADLQENKVAGQGKPSSELPMHTLLYREFPEIGAVVHTHSPYAMALAVNRQPLPMISIEGLLVGSALLLVTETFQIPGTREFAEEVLKTLKKQPGSRGVLLAGHGLLVMGRTLDEAASLAESIEVEAKVYSIACGMGTPVTISEETRRQIAAHYHVE